MAHDIFDSYAKLMEESGALDKPLEKTAEEKPLRHDSLDISDFQMLYGVKPNGKDEEGMIEQAHPTSVYIAPAYDKMNGLVENQTERQAIMMDIALKPNDGKLIQERYIKANTELVNELTRVAFLLDKNGETELMKIADECTEILYKKAFLPLLLGVVGTIGGVAALWQIFVRDTSPSISVSEDARRFLVEVKDVTDEYSGKHPEVLQNLSPIIEEVSKIKEFADRAARLQMISKGLVGDKDKMISTSNDLLSSGNNDKIINFFTRYKIAAKKLIEDIPAYISLLKNAEKEYATKYWDITEKLYEVYRFFSPSDVDEAAQQLEALRVSLSNLPADIENKLAIMNKLSSHKDNLSQIQELLENENMTAEQLEQMAQEQGSQSSQEGVPELPELGK